MMRSRYRNSPAAKIREFFDGTGIYVADYEVGHYLTLVTEDLGRTIEMNILLDAATGKLKIWREYQE